jgi:ABC-type transport system substrate-binding protein
VRGAVRALGCALGIVAPVLAGCSTMPPPAPVVSSAVVQSTAPAPDPAELIIGVDDLGAGFNPHALADVGPIALGIAGLVLPSVFRPNAAGGVRLDYTLAESATVTDSDPFTVTYRLRRDASWSDGAPIAAEDFAYLADRMRNEPGVVNPAGYRLIREVNSRAGGKTVEVVFTGPYPGWTTLFANLLPSHLLKDAPGGWPEALEAGIGVSGGPFAVRSVDRSRGMAVLERNDRYWETPAALDRLVFRESNDPGLVSALRTGGDQLALLSADAIAMALLRDLAGSAAGTSPGSSAGSSAGEMAIRTVPQPFVTSLALRHDSPVLADARVRSAIVAALDRDALVLTGTGNGPAATLRANSYVLAPSEPDYRPQPAAAALRPDTGRTQAMLTDAGYVRVGGVWQHSGVPLRLVIAAPVDHEPYPAVANAAARQLRAAGFDVEVITPTGDELFGALLTAQPPGQPVDLVVAPSMVSGDPATALASEFGCPPQPTPDGSPDPVRPANVAAFCEPALQEQIDGALAGVLPATETLSAIDQALWRSTPTLPLFQHASVLVNRPDAVGVQPGGLLAGPFANAPLWRRAGR